MTESEVRVSRHQEAVSALIDVLVAGRIASRLRAKDASLWGDEAEAEASIRLGWIDAPYRADALVDEIERLRVDFEERGVTRIVLCGMGGSSLAPEVIARRENIPLTVLDSTHPAAVARVLADDPAETAVVVSSKSGSTIETRSHLSAFEARFADAGIAPADRIVVVTDPGSPLEDYARERGYRVFLADPEIGGRFSALTPFGLVPSGLAGANVRGIAAEAVGAARETSEDARANPALRLAAVLAAQLPDRYACVLHDLSDTGLGDWIEQLVAESTGKSGHGVLPVVVPAGAPELSRLPDAAALVTLAERAPDEEGDFAAATVSAPLGAQFLIWETATAILCHVLGVNPFDQPDVESAKIAARTAFDEESDEAVLFTVESGSAAPIEVLARPEDGGATLEELLAALRCAIPEAGYLSIQAYLDGVPNGDALRELRDAWAAHWSIPVTLGWGPRFLHSTGQLHKGGPAVGGYVQILDISDTVAEIPGAHGGFGRLISAQARGDRAVLMERGRPVLALRARDVQALISELKAAVTVDETSESPA